ncbi:MAG TPA: alpha/beta hydrolase [Gemmatimonadaceae bacterium]|nr:alpha/beta hydrolase [Gemmatimonadaceae bacterium]
MISFGRRGRISTSEIFPAGHPEYRSSFLRLRSGLTIRAVESGDPRGSPVLIVPGWGCSVYAFRHMMPDLVNAGYRVIAVDLKGHGLSDKPTDPAEYTIDSLVDHLRDILDALSLERPYLVGHSMGGSLLYHFAARYRDRVRALAMFSPVGLRGVRMVRLYRALTPRFLLPLLRVFLPRFPVRVALSRVYGKRGTYTEEDVDQYWAPIRLPNAPVAMRELLHSYDWHASKRRRLEPVTVPAIAFWGSLDHLLPKDEMPLYQQLIPGIVIREVRGAGHVVPEETPSEVNPELIAFFKGH